MEYQNLIHETPGDFTARTDADRKDSYRGAYRAYTKALTDAGVIAGGAVLQPGRLAATVRRRHGKRPAQDGPYAEAKEQLGGGWEDVAGADPRRNGLAEEAIWPGRVVVRLLPDEPEAAGLLAPMLHRQARRRARRRDGRYVALTRQDVTVRSRPMIVEAEQTLAAASLAGRPGRFQLEAAIQSVHARRAVAGRTDWEAIALLYQGLVRLAAAGVRRNR